MQTLYLFPRPASANANAFGVQRSFDFSSRAFAYSFRPYLPRLSLNAGYTDTELEEEERLTIVDVASRVQQQVNERVTKKFYDRFREEHKTFLKFIEGIKDTADREWYASLMLNRLMFIYFIQKKGFLDDDRDYLLNRLCKMQQGLGKGHFHRFYRLFLLRLFHEGLGQPGARGGRAYGRNCRARRRAAQSTLEPTPLPVVLPIETTARAIAALDEQFPWLRSVERRSAARAR